MLHCRDVCRAFPESHAPHPEHVRQSRHGAEGPQLCTLQFIGTRHQLLWPLRILGILSTILQHCSTSGVSVDLTSLRVSSILEY